MIITGEVMQEKMKGVTLFADWEPKPDFKLGFKDIEKVQTYLGSKVWRNPRIEIVEYDIPTPGEGEVMLEVKACGICGSDVHMAQADSDGYTYYPGLTGFPVILGHEISGIVVKVGNNTFNVRTGKSYKGGEYVCTEEMLWCGRCKPCMEGLPNHCERLNEIGFNINGGFAKYIKVPAKSLWSLEPLKARYSEKDIFLIGSLIEPTSVAYNSVITVAGGIKPGDCVVIYGGGPIGLTAAAILKKQGAAKVILAEPERTRAAIGKKIGADYIIDPIKEDIVDKILELTDGMGANLYLESTGLHKIVWPQIEQCLWEGRVVGATVCIVSRADEKMPVTGEVLQVRRSKICGAYGHAGHSNFYRVIESIASGMDVLPLITKKIALDEVPENLVRLRNDKSECKITCVMS